MDTLLKIREQVKSRKPQFVKQSGRNLKKLSKSWRAPKGMHSKLRRKLRGHLKQPSVGYSSPKLIRGYSPSGLKPILITNENQLDNLKSEDGIIISRRLGKRKKLPILKKIQEKKPDCPKYKKFG